MRLEWLLWLLLAVGCGASDSSGIGPGTTLPPQLVVEAQQPTCLVVPSGGDDVTPVAESVEPEEAAAPDPGDVTDNFLANTQWQVGSGLLGGPQRTEDGRSYEAAMTITCHTTGSNTVTFLTPRTGSLKAGDLVAITGEAAPSRFQITWLRVVTVRRDLLFTAKLPIGLISDVAFTSSYSATISGLGNGASVRTGDSFDGWSKSSGPSGLIIWREGWPSNTKPGSRYSYGLLKTAEEAQHTWYSIPARDLDRYRGRTVAFGAWVKQRRLSPGIGTWRLYVNTGALTYSVAATESDSFQWAEITYRVPANAPFLDVGFEFDGAEGDVYYLSQPIAGIGTHVGVGNYIQPRNEYLIPVAHVQFLSILGAALQPGFNLPVDEAGMLSFEIDPYADTNGTVAPTVRSINIKLEARCETPDDGLTTTRQIIPAVFGPLLISTAPGRMMVEKGELPLAPDGTARFYSDWTPLSGSAFHFTHGSPIVTGTGARWMSELSNGMYLRSNSDESVVSIVRSRQSEALLLLTAPYAGATHTASGAKKNKPNWYNASCEINGILLS